MKGVRQMKELVSDPPVAETAGSTGPDEALLRGPSATPFSKLVYHLLHAEDEAVKAQMADDIEWTLMPTGQTFTGKDMLFQFSKAAFTSVRDRMPELLNNVAIGDWGVFEYWNIGIVDEDVIEFARATWGTLPSDISRIVGQTYKMPVCFVYHINAARQVDLVREYLDPTTFIRELYRPGVG
jgi:hypothetical protein